jgi:hypothetical protein
LHPAGTEAVEEVGLPGDFATFDEGIAELANVDLGKEWEVSRSVGRGWIGVVEQEGGETHGVLIAVESGVVEATVCTADAES